MIKPTSWHLVLKEGAPFGSKAEENFDVQERGNKQHLRMKPQSPADVWPA